MGLLDYTAMGHLMDADEPVGPTAMATRLGISSGSMTQLLDRLEQAGHVRREPDTTDRRRVAVVVTDSGARDTLAPLAELFVALDELAATFVPAEQAAIRRLPQASGRDPRAPSRVGRGRGLGLGQGAARLDAWWSRSTGGPGCGRRATG